MAERKKEVAERGIVGYVWTSQSPNTQALDAEKQYYGETKLISPQKANIKK